MHSGTGTLNDIIRETGGLQEKDACHGGRSKRNERASIQTHCFNNISLFYFAGYSPNTHDIQQLHNTIN